MSSMLKKLEKHRAESEQKLIVCCVIIALLLLSIGLSIVANLFLLSPSADLAIRIIGSAVLPACSAAYIFYHYYRQHLTGYR